MDLLAYFFRKPMTSAELYEFRCRPEHLTKCVKVADAEAAAIVKDPLGRTPNLPFGHMNAGWQNFLEKQAPEWKLWAFEVPGASVATDQAGDRQWSVHRGRILGYAWVSKRRVQAEFVVESD